MNRLGREGDEEVHDLLARALPDDKPLYRVSWNEGRYTWEVFTPDGWLADARYSSEGVSLANKAAKRALEWTWDDSFQSGTGQ